MIQPFEDFLVELCEKGDWTVLARLDGYLDTHLAGFGSETAKERLRVPKAFREAAPECELKAAMLKILEAKLSAAG